MQKKTSRAEKNPVIFLNFKADWKKGTLHLRNFLGGAKKGGGWETERGPYKEDVWGGGLCVWKAPHGATSKFRGRGDRKGNKIGGSFEEKYICSLEHLGGA